MRNLKSILTITTALMLCAAAAYAQKKQNGFSVILLIGENQAAPGGDNLPPAPGIRKALNDVKEFLPYRSYRVLDTQWLRSGATRMKGLDDQEYDVNLE